MTTRLNALATLTDGNSPFGFTNYENLQTDVDYLIVAGANIASASTINPDHEYHAVTGTTTIQNIVDTQGAVAGQEVILLFQSALTIQHLAGGTGNISLRGGDITVEAGTVLTFVYTGTVWQLSGAAPGTEIDYQTITAPTSSISATTEGTAAAVITGNAKTFDGTRVKIEFWAPRVTGAAAPQVTLVLLRDSTVIGQAAVAAATSGNSRGWAAAVMFDTPAAGSHTYAVKAFVSTSSITIDAGAGGGGALIPAFLRVTKA